MVKQVVSEMPILHSDSGCPHESGRGVASDFCRRPKAQAEVASWIRSEEFVVGLTQGTGDCRVDKTSMPDVSREGWSLLKLTESPEELTRKLQYRNDVVVPDRSRRTRK